MWDVFQFGWPMKPQKSFTLNECFWWAPHFSFTSWLYVTQQSARGGQWCQSSVAVLKGGGSWIYPSSSGRCTTAYYILYVVLLLNCPPTFRWGSWLKTGPCRPGLDTHFRTTFLVPGCGHGTQRPQVILVDEKPAVLKVSRWCACTMVPKVIFREFSEYFTTRPTTYWEVATAVSRIHQYLHSLFRLPQLLTSPLAGWKGKQVEARRYLFSGDDEQTTNE